MSTSFASWVRSGLAAGATSTSSVLVPATDSARLTSRLRVSVNGVPSSAIDIAVLGPGDVAGIDPAQVIRTDPHSGAEGFETTRFAAVEFNRPDLPWQFTPTANNQRLRPWISLVVVPVAECTVTPYPNRLAVLTTDQRQLPPISAAWAWAHVQSPGLAPTGTPVHPGARSRLVCPRQLRPFTRYLAAVVPNFEAGRLAGLALDPEGQLGDAWIAAAGDVDLPIYHSWFFATGAAGDFESLARGITALPVPPAGLGLGRVDVSAPGPAGLAAPGKVTDLLGPIAAPGAVLAQQSAAERQLLAEHLVPPSAQLVLGPPVYGAMATATDVSTAAGVSAGGAPLWVAQLNLHPAQRAAAGLGAAVVRRRQHDFVQEAWEQAGEVEAANRLLARGRLGRRISISIERRHVATRDVVDLLHLAGPVLRRLPHPVQPTTFAGQVRRTILPLATLGPEFRRLLRPTGPLARRGIDNSVRITTVIDVGSGRIVADRSRTSRPGGLVTVGGVLDVVDAARLSGVGGRLVRRPGRGVPTQPGRNDFEVRFSAAPQRGGAASIEVRDPGSMVGGTTTIRLDPGERMPTKTALGQMDPERITVAQLDAMKGTVQLDLGSGPIDVTDAVRLGLIDFVGAVGSPASAPMADLPTLATQVRDALRPTDTIDAAVLSGVKRPQHTRDSLEPAMVAPTIDEPLWDDLSDLAGNLFLPGADALLAEHATLLSTNPGFIAAFMAGANEEMMRELRWRNYPTDGRGTVFRRFWDRHDAAGHDANDLLVDLDAWRDGLGDDLAGDGGELVLVVRSEIFRRYPGTMVTAVKAIPGAPRRPDHSTAQPPSFHGTLPRGAAFFGFPINISDAVGVPGNAAQPGWFIVFHQPPTDLGFGVDIQTPEPAGTPPTWIDPTTLGGDAATVATATVQLPIRLAVHASDLVRLAGG